MLTTSPKSRIIMATNTYTASTNESANNQEQPEPPHSSSFFSWPSMMPMPQPPPHPHPGHHHHQQQQQPQTTPALQQSYQMPGYRDFANDHTSSDRPSPTTPVTSMAPPFQGKSSDMVFPQKLHVLLTTSEQNSELASIVSWRVHGRAFTVHDRKRFLQEILPEWFLQSRFESFQRQLNLYGFKRITVGPDRGACYHEFFLRQKPGLAARIQRIRLKGAGPRKPAAPELEPNFYRMPLLPTHDQVQQSKVTAPEPSSLAPRIDPTYQGKGPPSCLPQSSPVKSSSVMTQGPPEDVSGTKSSTGLAKLIMRSLERNMTETPAMAASQQPAPYTRDQPASSLSAFSSIRDEAPHLAAPYYEHAYYGPRDPPTWARCSEDPPAFVPPPYYYHPSAAMTQPPPQYHRYYENPVVPRLVSQQSLDEETCSKQDSSAAAAAARCDDENPLEYTGQSGEEVLEDYALIMSELAQGELPVFRR